MPWLILPFWTLVEVWIVISDIGKTCQQKTFTEKIFSLYRGTLQFHDGKGTDILLQVRLTKVRKHTSKWVTVTHRVTCSSGLIHHIHIAALESILRMLLSAWGGDVIDQFSEFTSPWTQRYERNSNQNQNVTYYCNATYTWRWQTTNTYIMSAWFY